MRKTAFLLGGMLSLAGFADPAAAETRTLTGQLIDLASYEVGHPATEYLGVHARACALEGFPVGILTADGKVYQITGELAAHSNAKLIPHILAKSVTITGEVTEKSPIAVISATDVK